MRALILDGPGEIGRALATDLGSMGVETVLAGRDPGRYQQMLNLRGDLSDLHRAAGPVAVVVNASGREDPRIAERVTSTGTAFVEIATTPAYLAVLAARPAPAPVAVGARLIPVLAGMLARDALAHSTRRGATIGVADPVEIAVLLGAGDPESAADTGSTYALLGRTFADPATGEEVLNFSGGRTIALPDGTRRTMTRVDFPDQRSLTAGLGRPVRTWFATRDRFSTALLQGLSRLPGTWRANRIPSAFHLPGTDGWLVLARAGRGRDTVLSWASGRRQAPFTARIAAIAARRAPTLEPGTHRILDLLTLSDLNDLEGLTLGRSVTGVPQA